MGSEGRSRQDRRRELLTDYLWRWIIYVLAVWFMDDGCRSRRAVYLNTQQFALVDQLRLLEMLQTLGPTANFVIKYEDTSAACNRRGACMGPRR